MPALFGDCAASGGAAMPRAMTSAMSVFSMTLLGSDRVVLEVTGAVGFRPQADVAAHWRAEERGVFWGEIRIRRGAGAGRPGGGAPPGFAGPPFVGWKASARTRPNPPLPPVGS